MKKFTLFAASCLMALAASAQTGYITPALNGDFEPAFDFNGTTNYVILYASDDEVDALGERKILKNESPTDLDGARPVYIWDNTYTGGAAEGFNSFNGTGGYMSFVVNKGGWSGLGHCGVVDAAKELDGFDFSMLKNGNWYFHMAMKDAGSIQATHNIAVGPTQTDAAYELIGDFTRSGDWYNIDIPLVDLVDLGFDLSKCTANLAGNVFTVLSGGVEGTQLNYDAVFFYQKIDEIAAGIDNVKNEAAAKTAIYTADGVQVSNMNKSGLYIVKTADGVKKVLKK